MRRFDSLNKTSTLVPVAALTVIGFAAFYVVKDPSVPRQKGGRAEVSLRMEEANGRIEGTEPRNPGPFGASSEDRNCSRPSEAAALTPTRPALVAPDLRTFGADVDLSTRRVEPNTQVAAISPDFELGEGDSFVLVDSAKPGHSFFASGVRIAVEGQVVDFEGKPVGLEFSVGSDRGEKTDHERNISGPDGNGTALRKPGSYVAGFSHEDALFRMKWGWAAYDVARRAALEADQRAQ